MATDSNDVAVTVQHIAPPVAVNDAYTVPSNQTGTLFYTFDVASNDSYYV
jgi:hypothetical protein